MAANHVLQNYGNANTQFDNVFSDSAKNTSGNAIYNIQNGKQAGGRRRRRSKSKCKSKSRFRSKYSKKRHGGNLPLVLGESMAPLALLSAQQYYKKRVGSRHSNTKRHRNFSFKRR